MRRSLLALAISVVAVVGLRAQSENPPSISTSASAEVSVPAYKARLTVGAVARSDKAKEAGIKVAAVVNAVRDALGKIGIDPSSLSSAGYSVGQDETEGARQPKAYSASSLLSVELLNLDQLGAVVDTALNAGATEVSEIRFLPRDADAARAQALDLAVAQARRDAEALAKAAGGQLGALLSVSTDRGVPALYETITVGRGATSTSIPPPEVRVSASVRTQWRFEPTRIP
ncbi:MAG: SIMPL domain-containing protein [Vicinamibacterales bacterium]